MLLMLTSDLVLFCGLFSVVFCLVFYFYFWFFVVVLVWGFCLSVFLVLVWLRFFLSGKSTDSNKAKVPFRQVRTWFFLHSETLCASLVLFV